MQGVYSEQSYRAPAVAGTFYPDDPEMIRETVEGWFRQFQSPQRPYRAALLPHAGWVYSGRIAAQVLARVTIPSTVIILCPKHHGGGANWAIAPWEKWLLPGAEVAVDLDLARQLAEAVPGLEMDARPHIAEHAIEVQLPLLAHRRPDTRIVALTIGQCDLHACVRFADAMAAVVHDRIDDTLFVISSDMNHFADAATTRALDELALAELRQLNPEGLYDVCTRRQISMCGMLPAVIVMLTLRRVGQLHSADQVGYATSGDVSRADDRVVGYAGVLFE